MMDIHRPEYAITKVNMASSTKRNKPLRTYGKRVTATPEPRDEPIVKRRRTREPKTVSKEAEEEEKIIYVATESPSDTRPTGQDEQKSSEKEVKKGSILHFFKPTRIETTRKVEVLEDTREESAVEEDDLDGTDTTAPSASTSPRRPRLRAKRVNRLLRLRTASLPDIKPPRDDSIVHSASQLTGEKASKRGTAIAPSASKTTTPSTTRALQDGGPSLHNKKRPLDQLLPISATTAYLPTSGKAPSKAKPNSTVQMTLNLSCQPAFSECKICDIVWNPLFPDDVAYHSKRHNAILRKERKRKEAEL